MSSPRETIPTTYGDVPPDHSVASATYAELQAAGFHGGTTAERKPGSPPSDELLVEGSKLVTPEAASTILSEATFRVLRDADDRPVATWDEGRWWTPEESAAYTAAIVAELQRDPPDS